MIAQRLESAQQHGQALALDRLADEQDAQLALGALVRLGLRAGLSELGLAGDSHAIGHDAVAPAVEAPGGPRRRLGHGDARVQPVHAPAAAEPDGDAAVGDDVLRVGVKGADQRQVAGRSRASQPRIGTIGSWMCSDVVSALAQLPAKREHGVGRERHVGDRAVGRDAERAPQPDEAVGRRMALGARTAVQPAREAIVGINGARMRASWPSPVSRGASASMCRVTPPGYVQEYGESSATRTGATLSTKPGVRDGASPGAERRLR